MAWTNEDEDAFRADVTRAGMAALLQPRSDVDRDARQRKPYTGPERRSEFSKVAREKVAQR